MQWERHLVLRLNNFQYYIALVDVLTLRSV